MGMVDLSKSPGQSTHKAENALARKNFLARNRLRLCARRFFIQFSEFTLRNFENTIDNPKIIL